MKKNILYTMIFLLGSIVLSAQNSSFITTDTIVNALNTDITDDSIVFPESMSESLADLQRGWQLDLSTEGLDCDRGQNVTYHDTVYANRLYQLPTVMELSYNSVVKRYIEMYSSRRREQVSYMLSLGDYYFPMFEEALDRHGLPLELKYLPVIESALNPIAVSRAGATGLWQFMLRTGKSYGLEVNSLVDERRDPYKSTDAAVRYLKDLHTIYGDWNLVIAAYNCGPGNVNKAIARSGGKRDYWEIYYRLPRETRGYVPAFIAANYIMNHFEDHNICPAQSYGTEVALDTIHVEEQIHFAQIAGVLDIQLSEIKRLNPQFKTDRTPSDSKSYALVLPSDRMFAYIDYNDSIINYDRDKYFTHRTYTDGYMDGTNTQSDGNSINIIYSVKRGDNLSTIARRNGTTVARLRSWNGLNSDRLSIGKRLIVGKRAAPEPQQDNQIQLAQVDTDGSNKTINTYYRVRKGDTLGAIAQRNSVNVSQLRSWNELRSTKIGVGDNLIVGQKIIEEEEPEVIHTDDVQVNENSESQNNEDGGSNIISNYINEQIAKKAESTADIDE